MVEREPAGARPDDPEKAAMKNAISAGVAVSVAGKLLYLATRLVTPPIVLACVTLEEYGVWATCFILIGYVGMGAFGVSNVYIRYSAEFAAKGETDRINRMVSTGLTVLLAGGALVMAGVVLALPWLLAAFKVPPHLQGTGRLLVLGTMVAFVLDLTFGAVAYVNTGLQRIGLVNAIWVVAFLVETVLTLLFLYLGLGIASLLWAFVARTVLSIVAHWVACRRGLPGFSVRVPMLDRESLRLFGGYGTIVQVSGLLGIVLRSIEKVVAGTFIGVESTALFDLGEKLPMMGTQIPGAITGVLLPASYYMEGRSRRDEVVKLYLKGSRYMNVLTGIMMGYMTAFAAPIITGWMGADPRYDAAIFIMAVFPIAWQMNLLTGPGAAIFRSVGKPAGELVYPLVQGVLVAITVVAGFAAFGRTVPVVAVAVAASMVGSALVYLGYTNRHAGVGFVEYAGKVLLPGIVPYLVGGLVLLASTPFLGVARHGRGPAIALVLVTGTLHGLLSAFLFYRLQCDWGEREFLRKQTAHTAAGLLRKVGLSRLAGRLG